MIDLGNGYTSFTVAKIRKVYECATITHKKSEKNSKKVENRAKVVAPLIKYFNMAILKNAVFLSRKWRIIANV